MFLVPDLEFHEYSRKHSFRLVARGPYTESYCTKLDCCVTVKSVHFINPVTGLIALIVDDDHRGEYEDIVVASCCREESTIIYSG